MGHAKEDLSRPPELASMLVQLCSARSMRDAVLGDLQESFQQRAGANARSARSWYWRQAFASITPLLRQRVNSSFLVSSVIMLTLTAIAFAGVYAWQEFVARAAARQFATTFDGVPIYAARLVYVGVQMVSVIAATLVIAALTFDAGRSLVPNAVRRLSLFSVLVIVPPLVESFTSPNGYPLDFVLPWAGAMTAALVIGSRIGARLAT